MVLFQSCQAKKSLDFIIIQLKKLFSLPESDVVVPDKGGKSSSAVRETCALLSPFFVFVIVSAKVLLS